MAKYITQIEVGGETYNINGGGGGSVGNALKQVSDMTTYTPTDGEIVQYIGATTTDYVHGGLYEYGSNMTTFNIGANKAGIPQGTYRTKAASTLTNIFASNYTGSDGDNYQGASQYNKLQVGDVAWNSSTYESFLITDVQNNGETLTLENGVTVTYANNTSGGSAQVYEIDGYFFLISNSNNIVSRAGVTSRSGFIILSDVGSAFNNYSTVVVSGWFQIAKIGAGNVTVKKQGSTVQTFNVNQQWNTIIDLPDDVVMCKILENRALASYATPITRFKYIEDHGWVDMDRSDIQYNEGTGEWTGTFVSLDITEGEYYYDMDNETVFVADENSEMQDVTITVVIQDDINKLYCDVDTNKLYRYDGTNFIMVGGGGYTLPKATSNLLGGVMIGKYLDNSNALTIDFSLFGTGDDEMPDVDDDYFEIEIGTLWFHIFVFKVACTDNFSTKSHRIILPFNFVFDFGGYIYDENDDCIGHYSLGGNSLFIYKSDINTDFTLMDGFSFIAFN